MMVVINAKKKEKKHVWDSNKEGNVVEFQQQNLFCMMHPPAVIMTTLV